MSLTEIDAIVNTRIDPQGSGVAVAALRGGQVIHSKGYGVAQLVHGDAQVRAPECDGNVR